MPDWGDPESIKRYLDELKRQEQAGQVKPNRDLPTVNVTNNAPRVLQPLVTGAPAPEPVRQTPGSMPDAVWTPSEERRKSSSGGMTAVPGIGMLPTDTLNQAAANDANRRQAQIAQVQELPGFTDWNTRQQQMGVLPIGPKGDIFDWFGLGNTNAAKYADWRTYQNATDNQPEQFPGQDAMLNVLNQWGATTNWLTSENPIIPVTLDPKNAPLYPGHKAGDTLWITPAEGLTNIGQTLNRTFNPFNPNAKLGQGAENQAEADKQLAANYNFRTSIPNLPPEKQAVAYRVWTANAQSNNAPKVYQEIVDKPEKMAQAKANMEAAQASGNQMDAAKWGQEYNRLSKQTEMQTLDENMNPWAEFVFGVAADPVDWLTSGATHAIGMAPAMAKTAASARKFNIGAEEGAAAIERAVQQAAPLIQKLTNGDAMETIGRFNLWSRTADAKQYLATRDLVETAATMFSGVTSKVDARAIVKDWAETGGQNLIRGLGLQAPLQGVITDADNTYRLGAGVLANPDVLKRYPLLAAARDSLMGMKSFEGDGAFRLSEFLPEFAKVMSDQAGLAYGSLVRQVTKDAKTGEEVAKLVRPEQSKLYKAISWPSNMLRGVLATMYLNLSPRNWMRQAGSQAAALIGDNTYSFRPIDKLLADVATKNGGLPVDWRVMEGSEQMFGEVTSSTLAQRLGFGPNNPLAKAERPFQKVWGGNTTVPLTGGRIPFGENAFYNNAASTTFLRSFNEFWKSAVPRQFGEGLKNLGIEDDVIKNLQDVVVEAGIRGGKVDVADALRNAVNKATLPTVVGPRIPDEMMWLEHRAELQNILDTFGPEQVAQAQEAVNGLIAKATRQVSQVLESAPPSIMPHFTADMTADDAKAVVAGLTDLAVRSGMAVGDAKVQATQIAATVLKTEADKIGAFVKDLGEAGNPSALDYAFDLWGRMYDLKAQYRKLVDANNKAAMDAIREGTPHTDAWGKAYQETQRLWGEYTKTFGDMMDSARVDLMNMRAGQEYTPKFNWSDVLERYWQYDDALVQETRALDAAGTLTDTVQQGKLIDANRQFIDHAYTELFSVFKQMPTPESFDIIHSVMRQAEAIGASAWVKVRKAADEALGSHDWNKFYAYRNDVWRAAFDQSVEAVQAAKRGIVWNWVVEQTPSKLKWEDDFAGAFQLLGPSEKPGVWLAKEDSTGKIVELVEQGFQYPKPGVFETTPTDVDKLITKKGQAANKGKAAAKQYESGGMGVQVPQRIIADYNQVVNGDMESHVDDILEAITPQVTAPEAAKVAQQATPAVSPVVPQAAARPPVNLSPAEFNDLLQPAAQTADELAAQVGQQVTNVLDNLRKAAAQAGIGTEKSDKHLINSIKKHAQEIGLSGPIRQIADLTPEDAIKAVEFYTKRAADAGQTMHGGLGAVGWPNWMVPRWQRGDLWNLPQKGVQFFADDDAYQTLKNGILQARQTNGQAPEMGEVALEQLHKLEELRTFLNDNMATLLAGRANTLTPAQKLQVLDIAAQKLMPTWDNVTRAAADAGRKMGNFAMMDFNDRRRIDTVAALVLPFHYYWSRSAKNWLERSMSNPALLDFWIEAEQAIALENQKPMLVDGQLVPKPERLRGTVPNPLKQVVNQPWMPDRLSDPLQWILPFNMYMPSQYSEAPETDDQIEKAKVVALQYLTDRMFPWYQAMAAKWLDDNYPLGDGKSRLSEWAGGQQIADYAPLIRLGGYAAQAAGVTGMPKGLPVPGGKFLNYGDEYDPYTVGRTLSNAVDAQKLDLPTSQAAKQIAYNILNGKPQMELVRPELQDKALKAYQEAVKAEGLEKLIRQGTAFVTGVNAQFYPTEEQQRKADQQRYNQYGYGPENLGGSKAAKDQVREESPGMVSAWSDKALLPGAVVTRPPGASEQISNAYDTRSTLIDANKAEQQAKVDAAIKANPAIKNSQMTAIKNEIKDKNQPAIDALSGQIKDLESKYPLPESTAPSKETYDKGMNPAEYKQTQVEGVYTKAFDLGKPAENASSAEKDTFYRNRDDQVVAGLTALGFTPEEAKKMWNDKLTSGQSDLEKAQRAKNQALAEERDAQWGARLGSVTGAFGKDAAGVWNAYYDLPKGDARKAYRDAHPEMAAYDLAAYEPKAFKFLNDKWGVDSIISWARIPKYVEGDDAANQARTDYLNANPKAWMIDAYVDGRPKPYDPKATSTERNLGKDYAEAERLFGPDIWAKVQRYRTAAPADRKGLLNSLGLGDWNKWWYGLLPKSERQYVSYGYRGGGGWGGGGGGGGGYTAKRPQVRTNFVDPRAMDFNLQVKENQIKDWRPIYAGETPKWMYAGNELKPTRTKWR